MVRTLLFLCMVYGLLWRSYAQYETKAKEVYYAASHWTTERYQPDETYDYLTLASGFSQEEIRKIPFSDRRILKIDLVYTIFQESGEFDQVALDIKRLEKLIEINPQITVNTFFDWNIIGQTGCESSEACLDFFHGFVIYYEDYFTKEHTVKEIDSVKNELSELDQLIRKYGDELIVDYNPIPCEYPELLYSGERMTEKLSSYYSCSEKFKGRVFFDAVMGYKGRPDEVFVKGNLFPCKDYLATALKKTLRWKRGMVLGDKQYPVRAKGFVVFPLKGESVRVSGYVLSDELRDEYSVVEQFSKCIAHDLDTTFAPLLPKVDKRVVSDVLVRNSWSPELFIVDVTGSMYPFTSDLLKWLKLTNKGTEKHYVFFNDGNDKPTNEKVIGSTGGIYYVKTEDFLVARNKMFEAMRNGGGGDLPENNFEALLMAVNNLKPTGDVIMVADNHAFPRDAELLQHYGGDLKIILCHTEKGVNTDYINLAKRYGFSIHTSTDDIYRFDAPYLIIDEIKYTLVRGSYIRN